MDSSWDDLRVLLAVHDNGSFLAAAKALGVSTSTIGRRIEAFETALGRAVVRRTADGATIAPSAHPLLRVAARMRDDLASAVRDAEGEAALSGTVRVSLGPGFLTIVASAISEFRAQHPETTFEVIVEARAADLTRREADVGIRTAKVDAEGVVARRAGNVIYGLFASESYLDIRAPLETVADFGVHSFVGYDGPLARDPVMAWLRGKGAARFPIRASTTEGMLALVAASQGIGVVPRILAAKYANLVPVRTAHVPPSRAVYVAMHRDARNVARVRAFADALTSTLIARLGPL